MQVVFVALATVMLGVGILANNHTQLSDDQLSAKDKEVPLVEESILGTATATPIATPVSTQTPSSTSPFVYPGSNIESDANSEIRLTTNADTDTVTDWYKNLFIEMDFSSKSTVKTKTNGVVNNKLSAANGELIVEVEVTSSDNVTQVTVLQK